MKIRPNRVRGAAAATAAAGLVATALAAAPAANATLDAPGGRATAPADTGGVAAKLAQRLGDRSAAPTWTRPPGTWSSRSPTPGPRRRSGRPGPCRRASRAAART
ncbi:hypothetical protein ACFQY7_20870 [Actinomadura luteofluorescens]|uniref:hypothetical protein n=1 Tax=Actinomadura luteofluorescens TaxID=46163 RepID=UPI003641571B